MRKKLQDLSFTDNIRRTFKATFGEYSKKFFKRHETITLLFFDLYHIDNNESETFVAEHIWCNGGKNFLSQTLESGHIVQFEGRIMPYTKGYYKDRLDYKIAYPTKVSIIGNTNIRDRIWTKSPCLKISDLTPSYNPINSTKSPIITKKREKKRFGKLDSFF